MSPSSPGSSSAARRLLVILRHSKAEAFAAEDHRRLLTARGREDAAAAGRWLAEQGIVPSHVFVSSATRAQDTWAGVVAGSGATVEAQVDDAVYSGDADSALDVLRTTPEDAEIVLYVGHNPTAASLAHLLDDGSPDPEAFRAMSGGFPPTALAALEIRVPWGDLAEATGHLVAFHVGRA